MAQRLSPECALQKKDPHGTETPLVCGGSIHFPKVYLQVPCFLSPEVYLDGKYNPARLSIRTGPLCLNHADQSPKQINQRFWLVGWLVN